MVRRQPSGLRLSAATLAKLREKAAQHGFTMAWLADRALNEFLDHMVDPDEIEWVRGDERHTYDPEAPDA